MAVQSTPETPTLNRAAALLFGSYLVYGVFWGTWVVVFADLLTERGLTEGTVGLQLAALSVVSILTMTLVAPRLQRFPLTATIPLGHLFMGLGAVLVVVVPDDFLALSFVALGVGNGIIDVFVNVGGQAIEARRGRPVLQYLHASYNVGGIIGALIAGVVLTAGVGFGVPLAATGLAFGAAAVATARSRKLATVHTPIESGSRVALSVFVRSPALILPAVVVLSSFLVEGSMDIWSVIFLRRTLEASVLAGAIAFAAFSLAMTIGRVTAARLLFGMGYRATLLVSGFGAFGSGLVAALTHSTVVAAVAFLFMGFFISSAAPAAFGMVAESDEDPALAIAGMTTVGYSGFVVGPPIMGWLAVTAGLRTTMIVLVTTSLGVVVGGLGARRSRPGTARP